MPHVASESTPNLRPKNPRKEMIMATIGLDKLYYAIITENEHGEETGLL